jgi:hypothetical protein
MVPPWALLPGPGPPTLGSWVDLAGNAAIHAPAGTCTPRATPAFTPRYARVARLLLTDTARWWRQQARSVAADLSPGTVSKVGHRLDEDALLAPSPHRTQSACAPPGVP